MFLLEYGIPEEHKNNQQYLGWRPEWLVFDGQSVDESAPSRDHRGTTDGKL